MCPTCYNCGGEISFRYVGGHCTPIHASGSCSGSSPPAPVRSYSPRGADNFCGPSSCPKCGDTIFFVRHNGGSVWFDELGWPWPKHACFDDATSPNSWPDLPTTAVESAFAIAGSWHAPMLAMVRDISTSKNGGVTLALRCSDSTLVRHRLERDDRPDRYMGELALLSREDKKLVWLKTSGVEELPSSEASPARSKVAVQEVAPPLRLQVGACYRHPSFGVGRLEAVRGLSLDFWFPLVGFKRIKQGVAELTPAHCSDLEGT